MMFSKREINYDGIILTTSVYDEYDVIVVGAGPVGCGIV